MRYHRVNFFQRSYIYWQVVKWLSLQWLLWMTAGLLQAVMIVLRLVSCVGYLMQLLHVDAVSVIYNVVYPGWYMTLALVLFTPGPRTVFSHVSSARYSWQADKCSLLSYHVLSEKALPFFRWPARQGEQISPACSSWLGLLVWPWTSWCCFQHTGYAQRSIRGKCTCRYTCTHVLYVWLSFIYTITGLLLRALFISVLVLQTL